jgi:UDP-N-acetyl-D-mannosaminuronate dehydrogenase
VTWPNNNISGQKFCTDVHDQGPVVAVIGVGYVGTHLVRAFAQKYRVLAFDVSENRLSEVAQELKGLLVQYTACAADLEEASHFLISVPTVLNKDNSIDSKYLQSAVETVQRYARPGSTVVVESSVSVGMTRELLTPLLESEGLKVGMSPEVRSDQQCQSYCEENHLTWRRELILVVNCQRSRTSQRSYLGLMPRHWIQSHSSMAVSSQVLFPSPRLKWQR